MKGIGWMLIILGVAAFPGSIGMEQPREPSTQDQQPTAAKTEPPADPRSQSLEAGLFDEEKEVSL